VAGKLTLTRHDVSSTACRVLVVECVFVCPCILPSVVFFAGRAGGGVGRAWTAPMHHCHASKCLW